jgi:hypothetical protein
MFAKTYVAVVVLAIGATVGWKYYASGELTASLKPASPPVIKFDNDYPATAAGPGTARDATPVIAKASSGVHKCVVNGTVSYTDAPCPRAGAEKNMGGGSVTVVKGQRPSLVDAASKSGSIPNVRDVLLDKPKPGEPSMMDKQIERAINQ